MDRRNVFSLSAITALGLALLSNNALGQKAEDVDGVKAASKAFYAALAVLDNGEAMEKVWAHTALRHIRRPTSQNDHCRLGCPEEVLGRHK
jgi:hypothetical protein